MPRRTPLTCQRQHYSRDLKLRVVYQKFTLGYATTKIAINLQMDLRVVQRVLKTYKDTGDVCENRTGMGRPPLMTPDAAEVSATLLAGSIH